MENDSCSSAKTAFQVPTQGKVIKHSFLFRRCIWKTSGSKCCICSNSSRRFQVQTSEILIFC